MTNLTTCWKDGLAFCALVHSIDPTALDYDSLKASEGLKNCRIAFAAAAKLGISALLDAEDVADIDCPEPLSMMTYISQYYHHVNGTGRNWNGSLRGASPAPAQSPAVTAARGHGLTRGSVDISAMELKRMRSEEPSGAKAAAAPSAGAAPAQEKAQAPVSYIPRPDLARTGSFRGSALARQQGLASGRAASPSPQAAERQQSTLSPTPAHSGLARQVSTPVLRADDQRAAEEKRKEEEAARRKVEEERRRKQQQDEAERQRAEAEAKRRESEARTLDEKRKAEEAEERRKREASEREEAAKRAKLQQETERRLAEQKRREEERQRTEEKRQRQSGGGSATLSASEEERKRARLARWAEDSAQETTVRRACAVSSHVQQDVALTVTKPSTQTAQSPAVDGVRRLALYTSHRMNRHRRRGHGLTTHVRLGDPH